MRVAVLMPCLYEEAALPAVLAELPPGVRVVLCDNGSTDGSVAIAQAAGAEIAREPTRGYGGACLAGLRLLAADPPDLVVIVDADHSVDLAELPLLLGPIERGEADMVLGDRTRHAEPGSSTLPQRVGNGIATRLIALRTGHRYADLGPFRAVRWDALAGLAMEDRTWGWNVEMQMKAVRRGMRVLEVPVHTRVRIGRSKISGTVSGVVRAGAKMMYACWRYG